MDKAYFVERKIGGNRIITAKGICSISDAHLEKARG